MYDGIETYHIWTLYFFYSFSSNSSTDTWYPLIKQVFRKLFVYYILLLAITKNLHIGLVVCWWKGSTSTAIPSRFLSNDMRPNDEIGGLTFRLTPSQAAVMPVFVVVSMNNSFQSHFSYILYMCMCDYMCVITFICWMIVKKFYVLLIIILLN